MATIESVAVEAYEIPTETPESDGTLAWSSTTWIVVELQAAGERGLGWTCCAPAAADLVRRKLGPLLQGHGALDIPGAHRALLDAVRNVGRPGVAACAISALDVALWDLKARILGVPLSALLGRARSSVPVYGSGGFTSYSASKLERHMAAFVELGLSSAKMKVGRDASADPERVGRVRAAVGSDVDLFVDANGAYQRKQALEMAARFSEFGVSWLEEPVSSDDLEGLRHLRDHASLRVAAGEYGYDSFYFLRMLEAGAVDVLMADATRCLGYTGFLEVAALARAFHVPLSTHCAPYLHVPVASAVPDLLHIEYFFDHARIEQKLLDGATVPMKGALTGDASRPGHGFELRRADAQPYHC
ncbi:MAG: mandelate racemase [Polyangiaceae bacterium]|nr:mandelate racemase [Polyangiaceae bacterium]